MLALRPLGLGDFLTGVPALRALSDAFPEHERLLAAPSALEPLTALTGAVDRVVGARPLEPLERWLDGVDVAINLHGRGPQSHRVLERLAPGRIVAFEHSDVASSAGGPQWRAGEHEVSRWCRLLSESGVPADPGRLELEPPAIAVPDGLRGATIVHPGAASAARRWPPERFAAVARAEARDGRTVLVTGDRRDAPLAREVARLAGAPSPTVFAGRTSLRQLAALVAAAGRLVCGDTGVAHLATAFGVPSVVLFGPVAPSEWGPPPDRPRHRALWSGRLGDPHGAETDPGLLDITVSDVLDALARLPSRPGPGARPLTVAGPPVRRR